MDYPYLIEPTPRSLKDIMDTLEAPKSRMVVSTSSIQFGFDRPDPSITFWEKASRKKTVPITSRATAAVCEVLQIPVAFFGRLGPELRQQVASSLVGRIEGKLAVTWNDDGLHEIVDPNKSQPVEARSIVEVAQRVIDKEAKVIDYWDVPSSFSLDVVVPGHDFGTAVVVGDSKVVGEYTLGGLRFRQIRDKRRLAPEVQEFFHRVVCTNGAECVDDGERVNASGRTAEQQITQLEEIAHKKFSRVTTTMQSFYELRERHIKDPERWINRIAKEQVIGPKIVRSALNIAPAFIEDDPTMFDIANLFTHLANEKGIRGKAAPRQLLQKTAGVLVSEHAARCGHCQSRLLTA